MQDTKGWTSRLLRELSDTFFQGMLSKTELFYSKVRWASEGTELAMWACHEAITLVLTLLTSDFCVEASQKSEASSPGGLFKISKHVWDSKLASRTDYQALFIKCSKQ